jgi:hypothetical protein
VLSGGGGAFGGGTWKKEVRSLGCAHEGEFGTLASSFFFFAFKPLGFLYHKLPPWFHLGGSDRAKRLWATTSETVSQNKPFFLLRRLGLRYFVIVVESCPSESRILK